MVSQAAGAIQPPIFRESLKPKSMRRPVVSPVMAANPFGEARGAFFFCFSLEGGQEPKTQAPLPVTVHVADKGRWFP